MKYYDYRRGFLFLLCLKIKHINMMNVKDSNVVVETKNIICSSKMPFFFKKEKLD